MTTAASSPTAAMDCVCFILCDVQPALCSGWRSALASYLPEDMAAARFRVVQGRLGRSVGDFDAIVSPANSYARLDASFDAVISSLFSPAAPGRVSDHCQRHLYARANGYLAPGTALLVPMMDGPQVHHGFAQNAHSCKFIVLCPTMRAPSSFRWNREVVYNCMWSLLCEIRAHNEKVMAGAAADKEANKEEAAESAEKEEGGKEAAGGTAKWAEKEPGKGGKLDADTDADMAADNKESSTKAPEDEDEQAESSSSAAAAVPDNLIRSVFVTGLGTGVGQFPAEACAQQMILAYKHFMHNLAKPSRTNSWADAGALARDIDRTLVESDSGSRGGGRR